MTSPMPSSKARRPIPITAAAMSNCLGETSSQIARGLFAGRTGLAAPRGVDLPFATVVGQMHSDIPSLPRVWQEYDVRVARIALAIATQIESQIDAARTKWGSDRMGLLVGTSTAGMDATEAAYAYATEHGSLPADYSYLRHHSFAAVLELLVGYFAVGGPRMVVSTACSSSAKVFANAQRWIESDIVDAVLVGGVDVLCELTLRGFHSLGILSEEHCRPFSLDRDGINIGEGGGFCLLERQGDAPFSLLGTGESSDAHHMSAPHPEGAGAQAAMVSALEQSGVGARDVAYVNAHGTGTPLNDLAESKAIHSIFGDSQIVGSTKSYTGHMLGAAGVTEVLMCMLCLGESRLPQSLGLSTPDPEIQAGIIRGPMPMPTKGRVALTNSLAFGGSNCSLVVGQS